MEKAERAATGKLEKVLILAFTDSKKAETGSKMDARDSFEALVNPETYTMEYKVETSEEQGQGTSGSQSKFISTSPQELTFEFLFDNTGLIDGRPNKAGIFDNVNHFRKILTEYQGDSHEPYHLKLIWGNLVFKGRAVELGITYKLFNPDGQPIRAVAKARFKGSIEEKKRALWEDRKSPDLTHLRRVSAGDTLPLMCYRIYGDPKYYMDVAKANGIENFRLLPPGMEIAFPPIAKTADNGNK
ncbi:MAG: LysM peptidoglycan-binding domain-containing protein [Deltaproteobacteria bacterium]|nr:LysM peptidoglycan-binding domain-containing protein [Deltaproteobacteria bacterium]MBZ0219722.1 LysM peptidoglycan-binding domain-containing protein [Deltaproteobacteria bacterium]